MPDVDRVVKQRTLGRARMMMVTAGLPAARDTDAPNETSTTAATLALAGILARSAFLQRCP
jgi:hypothetical protein